MPFTGGAPAGPSTPAMLSPSESRLVGLVRNSRLELKDVPLIVGFDERSYGAIPRPGLTGEHVIAGMVSATVCESDARLAKDNGLVISKALRGDAQGIRRGFWTDVNCHDEPV